MYTAAPSTGIPLLSVVRPVGVPPLSPGAGYGGVEANRPRSAPMDAPPWPRPADRLRSGQPSSTEDRPGGGPWARRGSALPIDAKRGYSDRVLRRSRQRRAALVIGVALVLVPGVAFAQSAEGDGPSLEQLVRAAMARDDTLAQRQLEVRNRQLAVAKRAAGKSFGLSLSLNSPDKGLIGASLQNIGQDGFDSDDDFNFTYGINTGVEANLPHPFGTISTTAEWERPADQESDSQWKLGEVVSIGLKSSVEQPLNPLLGLDADLGGDLDAAHRVVKAERGVRGRLRDITRDILERMKQILQRRITVRRSVHEIADLEDEVERRRDMYQDNEDSYSFQERLFNLEKERRALETTQRRLEQDLDAFEQRTGTRHFGLLTEALLELPAADAVDRAPAVVDAAVALRVGEHGIREKDNGRWPAVSVNAEYDWREGKLSGNVGFKLVLPILDGGLQEITAEELNNEVTSAKLDGASARREFGEDLIALERRVRHLDYRAWEHREKTRLAALKVVETQAELDAGVVVPSDLTQAELAHDLLALDGEILRVDRWLLKLDIDALTDAAPLDFTAAR